MENESKAFFFDKTNQNCGNKQYCDKLIEKKQFCLAFYFALLHFKQENE